MARHVKPLDVLPRLARDLLLGHAGLAGELQRGLPVAPAGEVPGVQRDGAAARAGLRVRDPTLQHGDAPAVRDRVADLLILVRPQVRTLVLVEVLLGPLRRAGEQPTHDQTPFVLPSHRSPGRLTWAVIVFSPRSIAATTWWWPSAT